jgi:hypothetical protein
MPNLIKSKLDLAKIHGAKVLKKDGRTFIEITDSKLFEGKTGAIYLDLAQFETTNDKFGNDWRISQDLPQAFRDSGAKGPILGNGKNKAYGQSAPAPQPHRQSVPPPPPLSAPDDGSSVPF